MKEELKNKVAEIKTAIADKVSEAYLKRAEQEGIEGNSLPPTGTFGTYKTAGRIDVVNGKTTDYRHLRMTVKGKDDSISVSNLKLIAPRADEELETGEITRDGALKGKLFLRGKAINPKFSQFSTLELIAYLEGKRFSAKKVDAIQLKFNPDGYSVVDLKKDTRAVTAYEVTVEE